MFDELPEVLKKSLLEKIKIVDQIEADLLEGDNFTTERDDFNKFSIKVYSKKGSFSGYAYVLVDPRKKKASVDGIEVEMSSQSISKELKKKISEKEDSE